MKTLRKYIIQQLTDNVLCFFCRPKQQNETKYQGLPAY